MTHPPLHLLSYADQICSEDPVLILCVPVSRSLPAVEPDSRLQPPYPGPAVAPDARRRNGFAGPPKSRKQGYSRPWLGEPRLPGIFVVRGAAMASRKACVVLCGLGRLLTLSFSADVIPLAGGL